MVVLTQQPSLYLDRKLQPHGKRIHGELDVKDLRRLEV
jgi:hypothetical protein